MTRGEVDYQKGLIYTITSLDSVYVGSTTNYTKRKCEHKYFINTKDRKLYQTIRENNCEWDMKPYKLFPCNSKMELEIEEEKIRRELSADLNMMKCRTSIVEKKSMKKEYDKEYIKKNYNKKLKQNQIYREKNRELIRKKDNTKIVCECGCIVTSGNLGRHKKTKKHLDLISIDITHND